jgi:hypothetical protein
LQVGDNDLSHLEHGIFTCTVSMMKMWIFGSALIQVTNDNETGDVSLRHCGNENIVKNRHNGSGSPLYKCKDCGKYCILVPKGGYSEGQKWEVLAAYHKRPCMREIQSIFGVNPQIWLPGSKKDGRISLKVGIPHKQIPPFFDNPGAIACALTGWTVFPSGAAPLGTKLHPNKKNANNTLEISPILLVEMPFRLVMGLARSWASWQSNFVYVIAARQAHSSFPLTPRTR